MVSNFKIVNDLGIHYLSAGSGDPILLLHGWPTSSYLWRDVMPVLAKTHRVIAMDLPGFGRSDKPLDASYSFRFYYEVINGFIETMNLDTLILGVHDLGGPIGLLWAVRNMKRVDKLIFLNTLVYPDFSWGVKLFGLATRLPLINSWLSSPDGIKRAMIVGVYSKNDLSKEVIKAYQDPFIDKNARKALLMTVQNLSPKGFEEISGKLPSFRGPVQIIYGERDKILPRVKDTMTRLKVDLPQAGIVSFADCGHFLQEEVGPEIGEIMSTFVNE